MKNLYLMTSATTVVDVGTILDLKGSISSAEVGMPLADDTVMTFPMFDFNGMQTQCALSFTFAKPCTAHAAINALLTSGAHASWCMGKDDGTAAPTAAASKFVKPATRTCIVFSGPVLGITERLKDTGPQVTVMIDFNPKTSCDLNK